jgi:hypothetical protein
MKVYIVSQIERLRVLSESGEILRRESVEKRTHKPVGEIGKLFRQPNKISAPIFLHFPWMIGEKLFPATARHFVPRLQTLDDRALEIGGRQSAPLKLSLVISQQFDSDPDSKGFSAKTRRAS